MSVYVFICVCITMTIVTLKIYTIIHGAIIRF